MHTERLTILRDALIEHAGNPRNLKFNLEEWVSVPDRYRADTMKAVLGARAGRNYCGTAACACGLAVTVPTFRKAGLGLRRTQLVFGDEEGWGAVEMFFDLSREDARELFSMFAYDTADERMNPLAVADKITALLETA